MNLQGLRDAVRLQLDLDDEDLPNGLLDLYIREGFERSMQREQQWPFYAAEWAITTEDGTENRFTLPAEVSGLVAISDAEGRPLVHLGHSLASESFGSTDNGSAVYFSIWGRQAYVWPRPTETVTYGLRGWRLPVDWVSLGATADVDADTRLHLPIIHYACSRSYAQQEDEILERTYLDSWDRGVDAARADIMRPQHSRPIIMNQGISLSYRRRPTLVV